MWWFFHGTSTAHTHKKSLPEKDPNIHTIPSWLQGAGISSQSGENFSESSGSLSAFWTTEEWIQSHCYTQRRRAEPGVPIRRRSWGGAYPASRVPLPNDRSTSYGSPVPGTGATLTLAAGPRAGLWSRSMATAGLCDRKSKLCCERVDKSLQCSAPQP